MGLFDIFKKKNKADAEPVKAEPQPKKEAPLPEKKDGVNLRSVLNQEEIRLLLTDLNCEAQKVPTAAPVFTAVQKMIQTDGIIPEKALDLCIVSTQDMIESVMSDIGITMGGHSEILKKLRNLKETAYPDGEKVPESDK